MLRHLREYAKIRCFFLYSILAVNRPFVHFLFCSIPTYSRVLASRYNRVLLEIKPSFSPLAVIRSMCCIYTAHVDYPSFLGYASYRSTSISCTHEKKHVIRKYTYNTESKNCT